MIFVIGISWSGNMDEKEIDNLFKGKKVKMRPLSKLQEAHLKLLEKDLAERKNAALRKSTTDPGRKIGFFSKLFRRKR